LLYEDETIVWHFALPRAGWWRKAQRARLLTRPLSQSQIKREESLKRQAWLGHRSWSRVTSGVLLSVIGAVQYGTSKVFYKIVPHFDAPELRQYIHQVMAVFRKIGKEVVMVVDRSGGSDIHVMLALCCRSRQVVMANEELNGPDMVGELLGKRQRRAYQTRNALSQRGVEPFDMIGFARELADRLVLRCRNHLRIDDILIRVKRGVVTVRLRHLRPQVLGTRVAAIAHVEGNDLAGLGIHGDSHPLLVGFLLHKAGQFIGLNLQSLDQHIVLVGDRLNMQMIGQGLKTLDEKA
jgi:hypothetical protein